MAKIMSFFMSVMIFLSGIFCPADIRTDYIFNIDTSSTGRQLGNLTQCVNVWEMGTQFINAERNSENDIFEFVEYIQLMACSGGTESRDLFKDPYDTTVKNDYDFSNLIENCRGILLLGAKPQLKFGNVPFKLTTDPQAGVFSDNVNPPDDYNEYYNYIAAIAQALCDEFGKDEVMTWRFGVMTEFENPDWFIAKDGKAASTAKAYCMLYDYTTAALQDVIGEDIYIGAHAMSVTEGLWNEEIFIRHCAKGTNYKTGQKGTRLCYLAGSFYDSEPGIYTSGYDLPGTIRNLRCKAKKYGLNDLDYGIDEGRILAGNTSGTEKQDLLSRSTGYTWQAAYDARLYGQMIDNDIDYFSYWGYLTDGLMNGIPSVSYHVSKEISKFAGCEKINVQTLKALKSIKTNVKTYAAFDNTEGIIRAFTYNYSKKLDNDKNKNIKLVFNAPQFKDGEAEITEYRIDDNCNFFDEWTEDRKIYGITDDMFSWSPDDFMIPATLKDKTARELFFGELYDKYTEAAVLTPETLYGEVKNGILTVNTVIEANTVIFLSISQPNYSEKL